MGSKPVVHRKAWRVLAGRIAAGSLCALLAGACSRDASSAAPAGAGVKPGTYRAFPTTIFIDRRGRVRKIHTGYSGPATGDHYTQFVAEFKSTIDQLLAET
jgi:hypothetical protein